MADKRHQTIEQWSTAPIPRPEDRGAWQPLLPHHWLAVTVTRSRSQVRVHHGGALLELTADAPPVYLVKGDPTAFWQAVGTAPPAPLSEPRRWTRRTLPPWRDPELGDETVLDDFEGVIPHALIRLETLVHPRGEAWVGRLALFATMSSIRS